MVILTFCGKVKKKAHSYLQGLRQASQKGRQEEGRSEKELRRRRREENIAGRGNS